jgi:hypothetical protein
MHDDYLQNVSVQSIAYVLAVLTWNGLTALLAGHSTFWGRSSLVRSIWPSWPCHSGWWTFCC